MCEHLGLQRLQRRARREPELLIEPAPSALEHLERVGLTAAAVQREHQLAREPLMRRVAGDQPFELGGHRGVAAELEFGFDPCLQRGEA